MKSRLPALLPALVILTAGSLILWSQREEIAALEKKVPEAPDSSVPRTAAPAGSASGKFAAATANPAAPQRKSSDARAAEFVHKLRDQARPLIDKADRERFQRRARFKADRAAFLLGLNTAEAEALRATLEKYTGADLSAAARAWIAAHKGSDVAQKYDAAENASRAARSEHDAQESIFRLSRIVDLTPDQKDRLYSAFVRKAATVPPQDSAPSDLIFSFSLQDTPSIPQPSELARDLLTKDQLTLLDGSRQQEEKATTDATGEVMNALVPAMLSALQETGKE